MAYLLVAGGLVLLFIGGEALVRGSVSVARRLRISELIIGLTLVGFGTSVPELVTSLEAVLRGSVGIAVGNVVGSNVANVLLVLGLAAMVRPILVNPSALYRDSVILILVTALFCALVWFDAFTRPAGLILIGLLAAYLIYSVFDDRKAVNGAAPEPPNTGETEGPHHSLLVGLLLALAGIAVVVFGARILVEGSVELARTFGVSETVIGLTIVAIGTSLPELATSLVAAFRGRSDVAIGNILGSNLFNILGILGVTAAILPFSVRPEHPGAIGMSEGGGTILNWNDIGALLLSVFLLLLFSLTGRQVSRWEGGVLFFAYLLYLGILFNLVPVPAILPYG